MDFFICCGLYLFPQAARLHKETVLFARDWLNGCSNEASRINRFVQPCSSA